MEKGFKRFKNFLNDHDLDELEKSLRKFHDAWLTKNHETYKKGAINSAYITNGDFITPYERFGLLKLISSKKVVSKAREFLGPDIRFLNTQIFFNPFNESQKNYWHRDIQYTGLTDEEQRLTIEARSSQVIHLRLALADEFGLDFIPESHFRWDRLEELDVRLQKNGRTSSENILGSESISLQRGDLLVFDANIIHRGLYGADRFAFDILFCKPLPEIIRFANKSTFPNEEELRNVECPEVFKNVF